jgi:protein-S-isoprenylcysteine O-methyltransferase Ste14
MVFRVAAERSCPGQLPDVEVTAEEALMRHVSRDLVDHGRTNRRYADESGQNAERMPGLVVVATAVLAFVVCLTNFPFGEANAGIVAAIVGLLALGAGLDWLAMDRRRMRQAERDSLIGHPTR